MTCSLWRSQKQALAAYLDHRWRRRGEGEGTHLHGFLPSAGGGAGGDERREVDRVGTHCRVVVAHSLQPGSPFISHVIYHYLYGVPPLMLARQNLNAIWIVRPN